jgi:hypothetical protein
VEGLAKTDPQAAILFALEKNVGLKGAMKRWAGQDPDAALQFALALEDPRHRRKALDELMAKLNAEQPARAEEIIASLPPGRAREEFRLQWLDQLANTDFDQAHTRAAAIDNPRARNDALYQLAEQIAFADPDTVLELVADAGRAVSSRSQAFGHTLAQHRPQAALELAAQISDSSLLYSVARHWVRLDPGTASQWILEQPPGSATKKMGNALIMAITRYRR